PARDSALLPSRRLAVVEVAQVGVDTHVVLLGLVFRHLLDAGVAARLVLLGGAREVDLVVAGIALRLCHALPSISWNLQIRGRQAGFASPGRPAVSRRPGRSVRLQRPSSAPHASGPSGAAFPSSTCRSPPACRARSAPPCS